MRGKTQLFRRNMTLEDLKKILDDPRTHTRKGYHRIPNSGTKYNEDRVLANPSSIFQFQDEDTLDFFENLNKESIDSISVGHDCFIILYTDGETAWSSGLPRHLYNKLKGRQNSFSRPEVNALYKVDSVSCCGVTFLLWKILLYYEGPISINLSMKFEI